ncbi:ribokinase [soil metagenome]
MSSERMGLPRVLVGGSINTDLVVRVNAAPDEGETVTGTSFAIFPGGKGANQAVAAARSGSNVAMLGAVGKDDFGTSRLSDLRAEQIETSTIAIIDGEPSGVALITVEASGQNRIAYVPGATWAVTAEQGVKAVREWRPDAVMTTLELPLPVLREVYAAARSEGIPIICNATPEPDEAKDLAFGSDILIVNETEGLALLDRRGEPEDWVDIGHALREAGPSSVIITLGSSGALVCSEAGNLAIAALQVGVVDTTGAGDAFCGAFATEFVRGADVFDAARVGVIAGSLAVTRAGAQPSMPTRAEIEARL